MHKLKRKIILLIIVSVVLSMAFISVADPLESLLKRTTDPVLKEKIILFKKGGYEKPLSFKTHAIEAIIKSAEAFIGSPHQMGGLTKEGIDCSGLVMRAHQQNGILLPHDGNEQARYGKIYLAVDELKRGDLVFFHSTYNTSKLVTHSGIYLGDNQFIHVSSKKGCIKTNINSSYWASHFLFGTRL